jgi:LPS O-antigen subunit length determinant protein (WzzB/FepE family)
MIEYTTTQTVARPADNGQLKEFSPKKFVLQLQHLVQYLLSKWIWIISIALLLAITGFLYASLKKDIYAAEITFALDEQSNPQQKTAFAELTQTLGLQTVPDNGGVFFSSMTNIVELLKSRFLLEKTLRDTVTLNGNKLIYIDFFLDSLHYRKKWMAKSQYNKTNWQAKNISKDEKYFQNNIMRTVCETISTVHVKVNQNGNGSSIFSVKCISENQAFSKYFLEALLGKVAEYYTQIKTERAKNNLDFIQRRTDSVRSVFTGALYGRASFMDANMNPGRQVAVVSGEKQQTDIQILRTSYIELTKALELAKSELLRTTPLFQYLDMPVLPLKKTGANTSLYAVVFFIAGLFFTAVFFALKRLYKNIMQ